MRTLSNAIAVITLAIIAPIAASADLTGTVTLSSGYILGLDTGKVSTVAGDLRWISSGSDLELDAYGSALIYSGFASTFTGASNFNSITQAQLVGFKYNGNPIYSPAVNQIFAVFTNNNNYAAVLVTAIAPDNSTITLQFITFTAPTISQVINNYGLIPPGFPNSGIAQGSLFIVKGGGLASATTPVLQSSAAPGLPANLNSASVSVTVNGTTVSPPFYYTSATQLDLVMPSNTPLGAGTVTVTNNGQTSPPYNINVVASAMSFAGYYGYGAGLGIATNPNTGAFYNYSNPIPPGVLVELWGSGLGADPTRDVAFSQTSNFPFSINSLAAVYVGGVSATVQYQGASGYPGVNQVNVFIPANVPTGCHVSVVGVTAAGIPTNFITLPIGTPDCEDPALATTGSSLAALTAQTKVTAGSITMNVPLDADGNVQSTYVTSLPISFYSYTGGGFATAPGIASSGSCIANSNPYSSATNGLETGEIMVIGQNLLLVPSIYGTDTYALNPGVVGPGGSVTFQADGSSQVGGFTATAAIPSPSANWTNQSAATTITRAAGLLVKWTGGQPNTWMNISGSAFTQAATGNFTCLAPVSAGQFTVPSYVFEAMPGQTMSVTVGNQSIPQTFSTTGIDYAYTMGTDSQTVTATLQ